MKQIAELIPLLLFVIAYKFSGQEISIAGWSHTLDGIYSATAVLIIASVIQFLVVAIIYREIEKRQWWMLAAIVVFGSLTLIFHNEMFIMWKPTIFNWGMGLVFLLAPYFMQGTTLMEKTMGAQIPMPAIAWKKLNIIWICHFTIVGILNIVVAYQFSQEAWVNYKLYSAVIFTLVLSAITMIIIAPHLKDTLNENSPDPDSEPSRADALKPKTVEEKDQG